MTWFVDLVAASGTGRVATAGSGLLLLGLGWLITSAPVAYAGGVLWAPAFALIAADTVSRGVGR